MTAMTAPKTTPVPATGPQVALLVKLVEVRTGDAVQKYLNRARFGFDFGLSKDDASKIIDALINCPKACKTGFVRRNVAEDGTVSYEAIPYETPAAVLKQIEYAAKDATDVIDAFAAAIAAPTAPAFGYYEINGTLYSWDVTGKDYRPMLRRLVKNPYATGNQKKATWRKTNASFVPGGWEQIKVTYKPYGGTHHGTTWGEVTKPMIVPKAFMTMTPLTQDQAGAMGKALSFCIRCGAALTDPVSVANGIGPVCAGYWG